MKSEKPKSEPARATAYVVGFGLQIAAVLVRLAVASPTAAAPGLVFYVPPVLLAAYLGGRNPGLATTALGVVLIDYCLLTPIHSLAIASPYAAAHLAAYAFVGVLVSFMTDALRRSKAEAEIGARTQAKLAQIIATAPGVVCSFRQGTDGKSSMPFAGPRLRELYGFDAEAVAEDATPVFEGMHPDDVEAVRASIDRSKRDMAPWRIEYRFNHPERGELWIEGHSVPTREEDGSIVWRGTLTDITDRRRSMERLQTSEARFRDLAENIREVFWLTDPAKGSIAYISPAYETIWGRTCASVYASPIDWANAIHADDRQRILGAAMTKQAAGTYDEEYRIVRPDGAVRWIHDRAFPVRDADGKAVRIAGIAEDITQRKELEEQVRQTQKMESVGLLAGGVAHDFNNLLTIISVSVAELEETVQSGSSSAERLADISKATERAASLTRQLLAFSRRDVVEAKVLDLNELVADAHKMLRRLLGEDLLVETKLSSAIGRIKVDPGHWVQVLMNLAVNARDAMPNGGRLVIETSDVVLGVEQTRTRPRLKPGRHVLLSMRDTGAGMSPEVVARVFEPFFTTKGIGHGTGLGLAVVHGIVEQSEGHIEIQSKLGEGTTFNIYLPTLDAPKARSEAPVEVVAGGAEHILLVEDEDALRRVAARVLSRHAYVVHEARDGKEALHLLDDIGASLDLVVTDVVMPNMRGPDLIIALKKRFPMVKVIYTSGYPADNMSRHGIRPSDVSFIPKPYSTGTLLKRVRAVLDGEETLAQSHC